MRFTVKRVELDKAIATACRAVASRNPVAVLQNLKFELDDKGLHITGSNYDLTIKTTIPFKSNDVELLRDVKEGAILINAHIIAEIAKKLESEELTLEVIDSTIATISDQYSEYKLNCVRPEEYPDIDLELEGSLLTMTSADFDLLVSQTAFAVSVKGTHQVLTAVNLEASDGILTATATDSARLAKKILSIPESINFNANVPGKALNEIASLSDNYPSVDISISESKALFAFGNTIISTRLIAGDYPNTKNIVPKTTNYTLEVSAQDLLKAINRANILSIDRENVVDLSVSSEGVYISAKSSQVGSAIETINTYRYEGDDLKISFNSEFVTAAVKALGSEDVTFGFIGEMKPFVIENPSDESIVQVVTPMRTY